MSWRVLVSAPYLLAVIEEYREQFAAHGVELRLAAVRERLSESQLLPLISDVDGVICGDDQFSERVFAAAPRLRVVVKWGTGVDSIDGDAALRHGVKVRNTPGAFTDPVADSVLGYMLVFARGLLEMDRDMQRGVWRKLPARALNECVLGVVGVGTIGRAVVRRARAFGMRVLGNDPVRVPDEFLSSTDLQMVDLPQLLGDSDFVTLHCTLNPTSVGLIGREQLALMGQEAYLINTSRGPVVDEEALADALQERRIAGAALDVFRDEPLPPNSPLRGIPSCLLAPHNANSGRAAWRRVHEVSMRILFEELERAY